MKLLLATTSAGKAREQEAALSGLAVEIVTLASWPDLEPPEESGSSFESNAAAKALYYANATGVAAIAEDAGLEVDALGGEPGVRSARWLGADTPYSVKNQRLLALLADTPEEKRTARYVSAVALVENGRVVFETRAAVEGRIADAPRGEGGFGYDPIFYCPPLGKTFAEIPRELKNQLSHRGKAMAELRRFLGRRGEPPARA